MKYVDLSSSRKSKKGPKKRFFLFLAVLLVFSIIIFALSRLVFNPISVLSQIGDGTSIKSTDGRTNILILGLDRRAPQYLQTGILTDTIILVSVAKVTSDIKIISIPRDLWVKIKDGQYSKVNEVYGYTGGPEALRNTIEDILGVPVHYHIVVGFDGFRDLIDALGGVSVTVENSFDDYFYPIEGKEQDTCGLDISALSEEDFLKESTFSCRYEHIKFEKGVMVMDGKTALKFVRSRHATNGEGTDFARARRQQTVLNAVKQKVLSLGILVNPIKIKELYEIYKKFVVTDISLPDVDEFYKVAKNINMDNINMGVLTNGEDKDTGGLLFHPEGSELYGGKWVLIPKSGDYSQIHAYTQKFLFSN